jgi:parallel beta-helix repeat protein
MSNTTQYIDAYYIDPKYGNDNNSGTINSPFKTIQKGVDIAEQNKNDGNKVYLRGGKHYINQAVTIDNFSGTSNAPLTIRSAPGEYAIVDGQNVVQKDVALIEVKNASRVNISDLEIRNAPTHGVEVINGHHVNINNNLIHHTQEMGIRVRGYMAENTQYEGDTTVQSSNITIDSNGVFLTNLRNGGTNKGKNNWGAAIQAWNTDQVKVTNNTVGENYGEGIGLTLTDDGTVSNNYLYDNFSAQVYLDNVTDSLVQNNFIRNTGDRRFYKDSFSANGIVLGNEIHNVANPSNFYLNNNNISRNITVDVNTGILYGTWGGRHQSNANSWQGLKNTTINNNTIYNSEYNAVRFYGDSKISNVNLYNNIFYHQSPHEISNVDNLTGVNFQRNVWFGKNNGDGFNSTNIIAEPLFKRGGSFRAADYDLKPSYFVVNTENSKGANLDFLFSDQADFGAFKPGEDIFATGNIIN